MAGLAPTRDNTIDGINLMPLLTQSGDIQREALYWHYPHYHPCGAKPYGAIRMGDYRLVEFYEDNNVELYNLKEDIGETKDLSKEMPEKTAALQKQLAMWRKEVNAQMPTPNPDYDPERADVCDP
ncbi:MAG: sulfatase/phosphatase domain-containing protein [bacterium]